MNMNSADIQKFYDFLLIKPLSTAQIALWHALNYIHKKCNQEWFSCANQTLELLTGCSRQSIYDNRNILKQSGLIDFKSNGTKATSYKITMQDILQDTLQNSLQTPLQNKLQDTLQNNCTLINKIKLNKLFNYLINKEEANFEEISFKDKNAIILILKHLEIYIENENILDFMNLEELNNYKIQYWCVKELYFSSFKIYLNDLDRAFFINKYLKTLENLSIKKINLDEDAVDIIKYFIKTLKKECESRK